MEPSKTSSSVAVTRVGKLLIPLLGVAYICLILITAIAKPVYSQMGALLLIIGGTAVCAAVGAILLILDYIGKEVE
jgi:predicted small integral membrane protein